MVDRARLTVLIVDDEEQNRSLLRRALRGRYEVLEACDGEHALEILRGHPVDVLITDQIMPGLSGVELLEQSITVSPKLVRIVLTATTDPTDMLRAINEGRVSLYLQKPIKLSEMERINRLLPGLRRAAGGALDEVDPRLAAYSAAAEAMEQGDLAVSIPRSGPHDTVGRLGAALDGVAKRMRSQMYESERLVELGAKISEGLVVNEVLDHVYESFRGLIPYDRIGFAELYDDSRSVRAVWARSDTPQILLTGGFSAVMDGSTLQAILQSKKPRILNDLEGYLAAKPDSASTRLVVREGMRSSLTFPLFALGKPVGFLFFSSVHKNAYAHGHIELFARIAGQLSQVVEKAQLFEQVLSAKQRLEDINTQLEIMAARDPMTGLANRRAFDSHLDLQFRVSVRNGTPLTLVMIDVDHFKMYNDEYGHQAGDDCLSKIATTVRESLRRPGDMAARYGGEEFVLVLPNTGREGALAVADRIRRSIELLRLEHRASPVSDVVTVSAGLAADVPMAGQRADNLLRQADEALYRAKHRGRNQIRSWQPNQRN